MSADIDGEEAITLNLLELMVSLSVRGEADVNRSLERIEKKAEETNRSVERLQNNAKQGAQFTAEARETGFKGLIQRFAETRRNAARGAEFNVEADAQGFEQTNAQIQRTRQQAARDASFNVEAKQQGFPAVIQWIARTRSAASRPADMQVRARESGFAQVNSVISRTSGAADRLDGKNVSLRTTLSGGDQVRAGLQAIQLRSDRLDGGTVTLSTDLRNGRQVISELQGVDNVSSRIDGDRVTVTANVDGTAQGRAALQSLQAAANGVDGDDVRLSASVTGTQSAIGELAALNAAASQVDGRNVRLNVDGSSVGILGRIGQSISDTAQRIRNFNVIGSTVSIPGLLAALGAIPALASAAAAAVGGLASALGQALAGAAGIGGSALAGMAGGFGLILAAAQPTIAAFSEHEQATNQVESAQKAAQSSADSLADAQRGVTDAARGVRDAQRGAAEGVAAAQQQYKDAQRGVAEAERGVAEATRGVADARREAHQGVAAAQQQYREAQRGVADAERSLAEATRGVADARREANEGVRSAQQQYRDALRGVADAERSLQDATRAVADARREAYQGVQQAVRNYQDAVRGVRDAERELEASRRELGSASVDLWHAQQDLNQAMRDEPRNQAYATLDLADARDRASDATREYNQAVREYGAGSEEATDADRARKRALLDLQAQEQETAEIRRKGSDELNAARDGVINASEAETEARRGVAESERGLQAARRDAAQAYAGIAQAEREGARQVAEAQRGVADAQRGVAAAQRRAHEAARGIETARIEGARKVADAQRQVADAQRGVQEANRKAAEAARGIEQARIEGARRVADAQQQVADAQRGVAEAVRRANEAQAGIEKARMEGARQVADAQRALIDAQRQLARAARDNRDAQSELGEALSAVGARLTATQQKLLNAARRFGRAFNQAFRPANDALNMLGVRILGVAQRTLPILGRTATRTVGGLNRAFSTLLSQWTAPRQLDLFRRGLAAIPRFTRLGAQSAGQLGTALANIFIAAIPQARGFLESLNNVTRRFSEWTRSVEGQRALQDFFQRSARYARILGASFVDLLIGVKQLFGAFDQAGTTNMMLQGFRNLTREFRNFTAAGTEGRARIVGFFRAAQPTMRAMWGVVRSLVGEFFRVSNAVLTMRDASGKLVMPQALNSMQPALRAIGDLLIASFRNFGPLIGPAIQAIAEFMTIFVANNPVLRGFARAVIGIVQAFNNLDNRFGPVGGALQTLIVSIVSARIAMKALGIGARLLFSPFGRITSALGLTGTRAAGAAGPVTRLKNAFTALKNFLAPVGRAFMALVRPISTRLAPVLGRVVSAIASRGGLLGILRLLGPRLLALGGPIGIAAAVIITLAQAFMIAYRRSDRFRALVQGIGRWFANAFRVVGQFARIIGGVLTGNMGMARRALAALPGPLQGIGRALGRATAQVRIFVQRGIFWLRAQGMRFAAWWRQIWPMLSKVLTAQFRLMAAGARITWRIIRTVVGTGVRITARIVRAVWNQLTKFWQNNGKRFSQSARATWRIIRTIIGGTIRQIGNVIKLGLQVITGDWRGAGRTLQRMWRITWNAIKTILRSAWVILRNLVRIGISAIGQLFRVNTRIWSRIWRALWNGLKRLASAGWNALQRLWDRSLTAIGNRLRSWGQAARSLFSGLSRWATRLWTGFWRGLRNLWDSALRAIGNRTESWRNALRALMDRIARWVRDRWNSFWSGLRGLWDRALRAVGNRTESWRDALRSLMDRIAKWVRSRWDAFWGGLRGLWDRALRAIGNRTEAWRDALRSLFDRIAKWARSRWDSFWSGLRGLWDRSLTAIGNRLRSWGDATRRLFGNMVDAAKSFGDNLRDALVSRISSAVNRVRRWLGGLAIALSNVLKALGMDKFAGNLRDRGETLKQPLTFARGGIARAKDGPGIVAEAGDDEAVVNLRKRTSESQRAFRAAQDSPNAPQHTRGGRPPRGAPTVAPGYPPPHGAHSHDHEQLSRSELRHKQQGVRGAHPDFSRNHKNVYDYVRDRANRAASAVSGVSWNTYHHHITSPGANEHSSVDFWGGAPGRAIGKSKGDRIAEFVRNNLGQGNLGTIWNRRFSRGGGPFRPWSGGPHTNHVHVGWSTDKDAKIVSGGGVGGAISGVMDALGNAYNSVTDFISQKFKPPEIPDLGGGPFFSGLVDGLRKSILGRARDWITDKASEMLSIGGDSGSGTPAPEGQVRDWIEAGFKLGGAFPASDSNVNKMYGRVMQESGGNPRAVNNWDSNARRGTPSKGLVQIIEPTWNANTTPEIGQFDANWDKPEKSVAVSSRYMKNEYGYVVGSTGRGYERGGVVPGPIGRAQQAIVHGGERVLPASLARGFEVLARALNRFSALGRGSALERVAQALTRALGGARGLRNTRSSRTRQHLNGANHTPRRSLSQRIRAWNDQPDSRRFARGVPDELERDARAAGYSLAEDLTFVRSGFYTRPSRPRVQPRTNRLPVNSANVARNIQINAGMNTRQLEREIQDLKGALVSKLGSIGLDDDAKGSIERGQVNGSRRFANSREGRETTVGAVASAIEHENKKRS